MTYLLKKISNNIVQESHSSPTCLMARRESSAILNKFLNSGSKRMDRVLKATPVDITKKAKKTVAGSKRHHMYVAGDEDNLQKEYKYSGDTHHPFDNADYNEPFQYGSHSHTQNVMVSEETGKKTKGYHSGFNNAVYHTLHKEVGMNMSKEQDLLDLSKPTKPFINKMTGQCSINVSVDNPFCQKMYKLAVENNDRVREHGRDSGKMMVCEKCYARSLEDSKHRGKKQSTKKKFLMNAEILTKEVIPFDDLPRYKPGEVIRFNAFGDVSNLTHVANLMNIVSVNPQAYFSIWTKNTGLMNEYFAKGFRKPKNLTMIWSNPMVDSIKLHSPGNYPWVDGVFNVVELKDINNLSFGDIDNVGKYTDVPEDAPINWGYNNTLGVTFVKCHNYCVRCRACYSGKKNFVVIEELRNVKG